MRTILTAVLLCSALSLSPVARAAEKPAGDKAGGDRAAKMRERMQEMTEKLGLNESQKEKFRGVWQERMEKSKEIFGDSNLSQEQKMEKMKAIRDEYEPKIKAILTPEQAEKWQKMQEEMRSKMGERFKGKKKGGAENK
jgi:Spy/CpxP family protein refolding chaperone